MAEQGTGTNTTSSGMTFDNESSTHADVSYSGGTLAGDYQNHEQTQLTTPTEHLSAGSDTNASGHFASFHDFGVHESSSSYFNLEEHPAATPAAEHPSSAFEQHYAPAFADQHHGSGFDSTSTHDVGHSGLSHHDSGPSDHGGSHADSGSGGAGH